MNTSLEQHLRQVTPPKTMKQAQALAAFGDATVPYLMPKPDWSAETMAAGVRALALIRSELALAMLEQYAADGRKPVTEELERAWNTFDREEYARRVLTVLYRELTHLELKHPPTLDGVQHFSHLRSLRIELRGDDIGPLAGLTQLEELDLSQCPSIRDLTPLRNLTNLHTLKLKLASGWNGLEQFPYDLEPLGHLSKLTALQLGGRLDACDFSFLSRLHHLRELDICGPGDAILSQITHLTGLRKLCIPSSTPVLSLDPLSHLTDLTHLSLTGWWLSDEELGTRTIDLSPLARLVNLTELSLPYQHTPTNLSFLQDLEHLEYLFLPNCTQLEDFSPLADLPRLASLSVRDYSGEHLRLERLSALTSLSLTNIRADTLLLADLPVLNKLHLEKGGPVSPVNIHSLVVERVPALPELNISSWWLRQVTCIDLPALSFLTIDAAHLLELVLHNVPHLTRISLYQANRLQSIRMTGETQLKTLSLDAANLPTLPQFEGLSSLEKVWIYAPKARGDLSPLQQLPQLRELSLRGLQEVEDFTPLTTLPHLEDLHLEGCSIHAEHLAHLPTLTSLTLKHCIPQETFTLEDLSRLRILKITNSGRHQFKLLLVNLPTLQSLRVDTCDIINSRGTPAIPWEALPALTELHISSLQHDLESLPALPALHKLDFHRCHRLENLEPLTELHTLKSLGFFACFFLKDLTSLSKLSQMESLAFTSCATIDDLTPLSSLSELTTLSIYDLESLQDLSPIANLHQLTSLTLGKCQQLRDLSAIAQLTSLQEIQFSRCALEDLSILQHLPALRKLILYECKSLRSLQPLLALPQLEELEVIRMRQVEVPPELKKRMKVRRH